MGEWLNGTVWDNFSVGTTIGCTHTRNTKANESIETAGKQAMLVVQKDYNNLPDSSSRSPLKLTAHY